MNIRKEIIKQFFVVGEPIAQPRQRHSIMRSKKTGKQFVNNYTPAKAPVYTWKERIIATALLNKFDLPINEPIAIDIVFYFKRPKSHYVANKLEKGLKKSAPKYMTKKPDKDNLDKAVYDALTYINYIYDDKLVCAGETIKYYAESEEQIGADIKIWRLI